MFSTPGRMTGRTVLVTGGTGGIGKATAIGLAALGARVGITGRDPARAQAAAADISRRSGNPAVDAFAADLSSQTEVRRLAAAVLDAYPRLDVLVNNVGGFWAHRHVTADGLEHTFAVNHLASVPAHRPAPGPAQGQRPGADRHRVLQRTGDGAHRLRRPAGRNGLLGSAGLQPVQTRQRHVHLRTVPPPGRHRGDRQRSASRGGAHRLRRRRPHDPDQNRAAVDAVHEDTRQGRGHLDLPRLVTGRRGRHRPVLRQRQTQDAPTNPPTTPPRRTGSGRSAPAGRPHRGTAESAR